MRTPETGPTTTPPRRLVPVAVVRALRMCEALEVEARRQVAALDAKGREATDATRARAQRAEREEEAAALVAAWLRRCSAEGVALRARQEQVLLASQSVAEAALNQEPSLEQESTVEDSTLAMARRRLRSVVRRAKLYVNAADVGPLNERLDALGLSDAVEMQTDTNRPRGQLRVEVDPGALDIEITCDLDRLFARLRPC